MAFHQVTLPDTYSYGFRNIPTLLAKTNKRDSGAFSRQSRWQQVLHKYTLAWENADRDVIYALISFFHCRLGKAHSFKFKDWLDFTSAQDGISTYTGLDQPIILDGAGRYRLNKQYGAQNRLIFCPTEWVIMDDGVDVTSSCSVNTSTGVITGYTPSGAFTAGFKFCVPVRFQSFSVKPIANADEGLIRATITVASAMIELMEELPL